MNLKFIVVMSIFLIISMILSGCQSSSNIAGKAATLNRIKCDADCDDGSYCSKDVAFTPGLRCYCACNKGLPVEADCRCGRVEAQRN